MNRIETETALIFYRDIADTIKANNDMIKYLNDTFYYHAALKPSSMDGMPKGSNNISNPTAKVATSVPSFVRESIDNLESDNEELNSLAREITSLIGRLPVRENEIIFAFYIKCEKWEHISEQKHYSVRQCKRIRNHALNTLGITFQNNDIISKFNFHCRTQE